MPNITATMNVRSTVWHIDVIIYYACDSQQGINLKMNLNLIKLK